MASTSSTEDRRRNTKDLEDTLRSLAAARDFDQPVELTPRQASLLIMWLRDVHRLLPYGF